MDSKVYKNASELMAILESKGMVFSQPVRAKRLIIENNYYSITAFKHLFYKRGTNTYIEGTDFENIFDVYTFDKKLKTVILRRLLFIEQKIKSAISIVLSENYGIKERNYLKRENFDVSNPNLDETLKKIKKQKKLYGSKNRCVSHYKNKYGYIPFWVLSKCLTMGVIRDLFNVMKSNDQYEVAKLILEREIPKKPVKTLKVMIALIADIRNMCAHDEVLLNYKHERLTLPPLFEHEYLQCSKNENGAIIQGRCDLLALLITIRYLINRTLYSNLITKISSMSKRTYSKISNLISRKDFLDYIGLCDGYEQLSIYKEESK